MSKEYEVTCANPECGATFTLDADPAQLTDDKGCVSDCPECGEDTEYDYDPVADELTITPGQEDLYGDPDDDDSEEEDLDIDTDTDDEEDE